MKTGKQTACYAALFILAVITGIIVGVLGQPYDTVVFTLHKIISIAAIIIAAVFIRRQIKQTGLTPALRNSIIVLSLSALALVATGALMSLGFGDGIIRAVHAFAPLLAAAVIVLINISFLRKRQEETSLTEK